MEYFFARIYYFVQSIIRRCFFRRNTYELPIVSDENWLLQKIEPIINGEKISDKEKIETLKSMIDNYDPLEY